MKVAKAGALYFALTFAAGFMLGPIRVFWAIPRFGERAGELMEMPIMLIVMVLAARWAVRRLNLAPAAPMRLAMGATALTLLVVAELGVVFFLRGLTLGEYVTSRDPVAGAIYIGMLGLFMLMPVLVDRRPGEA